jgi:hypothetical protein
MSALRPEERPSLFGAFEIAVLPTDDVTVDRTIVVAEARLDVAAMLDAEDFDLRACIRAV